MLALRCCACNGFLPTSLDFFVFNDPSTTEIYTLSLHDALPIWFIVFDTLTLADDRLEAFYDNPNALRDYFRSTANRSEERFSRNAETDLVCRLLLEKKKKTRRPYARRAGAADPGGVAYLRQRDT